jgi:hypothetical protein
VCNNQRAYDALDIKAYRRAHSVSTTSHAQATVAPLESTASQYSAGVIERSPLSNADHSGTSSERHR